MFYKKKICNSKNKFLKSLFHKKKIYWTWIWKMLWSKKGAQGSYYWAQKKFLPEKIKIEGVAFISKKYLKSHFRESRPKKAFLSISYFDNCFDMQSLPTANCSLVWPNFCTPYWAYTVFLLVSLIMWPPRTNQSTVLLCRKNCFLALSYMAVLVTSVRAPGFWNARILHASKIDKRTMCTFWTSSSIHFA